MRIGTSFALALAAAAALLAPSCASAQGLRLPENASFLVAGMANHAEQGDSKASAAGPAGSASA